MLIFLEIPYENGIILSQSGVQANHMNPLCIILCRSLSNIINKEKEIRLYKYVDIFSFFFMGLLFWTHMGPIWATHIWASPYGTHMEPGCTSHMGSPYRTHICMFAVTIIFFSLSHTFISHYPLFTFILTHLVQNTHSRQQP